MLPVLGNQRHYSVARNKYYSAPKNFNEFFLAYIASRRETPKGRLVGYPCYTCAIAMFLRQGSTKWYQEFRQTKMPKGNRLFWQP